MPSVRLTSHRVNQSFPQTQNQSRQRLRHEGSDQRTGREQDAIEWSKYRQTLSHHCASFLSERIWRLNLKKMTFVCPSTTSLHMKFHKDDTTVM